MTHSVKKLAFLASMGAIASYALFIPLSNSGLMAPDLKDGIKKYELMPMSATTLYSQDFVISRTMTWDQIRLQRQLSEELIVESHACTSRVARKQYSEIRNVLVDGGSKVAFVFRAGACPRQSRHTKASHRSQLK